MLNELRRACRLMPKVFRYNSDGYLLICNLGEHPLNTFIHEIDKQALSDVKVDACILMACLLEVELRGWEYILQNANDGSGVLATITRDFEHDPAGTHRMVTAPTPALALLTALNDAVEALKTEGGHP